jgi:hypothetical protein
MPHLFKKHYTREEARALLPDIREWLEQLDRLRKELQEIDAGIASALAPGVDLGGPLVNRHVRVLAAIKGVLGEFQSREIQVKDLERGLIDFPAFIGGKEAFLCWEKEEDDIEYWHDLNSGYAGREKL